MKMKIVLNKPFKRMTGSINVPKKGLVIYMMQDCHHCHKLAYRINGVKNHKPNLIRKYFVYSETNKTLPKHIKYFPSFFVDGVKVVSIPKKYV